jgi:hypothetical protein
MTHLFRPQDPVVRPTPPVGTWLPGQWAKAGLRALASAWACTLQLRGRRLAYLALAALGLLVELVLMFVAFYLVDLSISLMELWAELARKHLEITLS